MVSGSSSSPRSLLLAVNHLPTIEGTDHAIWRRIRLIPFTVNIPEAEQDKQLTDKLRAEGPGILRWAVEGCLAWQRDGLTPPPAVLTATDEYRDAMDTVAAFLECCSLDPAAKTLVGALYESYALWCIEKSETALTKASFGTRLQEKGFTQGRTKGGRYWVGLTVTG